MTIKITICLGIVYLLMFTCFLTRWLAFFRQDTSLSSQEKPIHLMILVIVTILWPIVVPLAYLELLSKKKKCNVVEPASARRSHLC